MVHVIINSHKNSTQKEELVFLDFQGSFDCGEEISQENLEIGDLTLTDDSAILITGHHRLVGKKVKLQKPFAVLHKKKVDPDMMSDEESTVYDVVTILKEKYIFSNRPGVIVQESLRGLAKIK